MQGKGSPESLGKKEPSGAKPHTYPTGRFNTVALVAYVCIFSTSSPGVTHFQEKCSTFSSAFEIPEPSRLAAIIRKKGEKKKKGGGVGCRL